MANNDDTDVSDLAFLDDTGDDDSDDGSGMLESEAQRLASDWEHRRLLLEQLGLLHDLPHGSDDGSDDDSDDGSDDGSDDDSDDGSGLLESYATDFM
jgi:hypothetical protein